jgi:MinD-like ATPase involved in chromosome partitioning or flagellar assembly
MPATITTFYSYNGGLGQTAALANVGVALAQMGYRVMMIDFDLESPGLDKFVRQFDGDFKSKIKNDYGTLSFLRDAVQSKLEDIHICAARHVQTAHLSTGESIDVMLSSADAPDYGDALAAFSWKEFFGQHGGGEKIEAWRNVLLSRYDCVLIDSRTGLTDTAGVCTVQLPDTILTVYGTSLQSIEGTVRTMRGIHAARSTFALDRTRALVIPVLGKSDARSEFRESQQWVRFAHDRLAPLLEDWLPEGRASFAAFQRLKVPYVTYFSYGERLAVLEDSTTDPELPGYIYTLLAKILSSEPSLEVIFGTANVVGKARPATAEDQAPDAASITSRILYALEQLNADLLPGIVELLSCFYPYLTSPDEQGGISESSLRDWQPEVIDRLTENGYLVATDGWVRLTKRGHTLAEHLDRLEGGKEALGRAIVVQDMLKRPSLRRFADVLALQKFEPYRLSRSVLISLAEDQELANKIARQYGRSKLRGGLLGAALVVLVLASAVVSSFYKPTLYGMGLYVFGVVGAVLLVVTSTIPLRPINFIASISGLRALSKRGLRYRVAPWWGKETTMGGVIYEMARAGFRDFSEDSFEQTRQSVVRFSIDDGLLTGLERTFGFASPISECLSVIVSDPSILGVARERGSWVVVYPEIFESKLDRVAQVALSQELGGGFEARRKP